MPNAELSLFALPGIPEITPGDDLGQVLVASLAGEKRRLADRDVIVVCQKVISKSEGRYVRLSDVSPSRRAFELASLADKDPRIVELILSESSEVIRCAKNVIIVRHRLGLVMANAGIDQSNLTQGDERALLLPENPDASAHMLRQRLQNDAGVCVGVIVNDSFGRAWRRGTCGVAIGASGFTALADLRGQRDRAGRVLRVTEVAVADELAAAASLLMGQGAEGRPAVVVSGVDAMYFSNTDGSAGQLIRPLAEDLFR